jgi:pumilio homology domain family member 6
MAGIKRKSAPPVQAEVKTKSKKAKVENSSGERAAKPTNSKLTKKAKVQDESDSLVESDTSEDENGFYGFEANSGEGVSSSEEDEGSSGEEIETAKPNGKAHKAKEPSTNSAGGSEGQKQTALAALNGM